MAMGQDVPLTQTTISKNLQYGEVMKLLAVVQGQTVTP
jgi:hypothetical protein